MAFPAFNISCGYAASPFQKRAAQALPIGCVWQEAPNTATLSTNAAPAATDLGQPVIRVRALADSWLAIGPAANSSTSPRWYIAANTDYDFYVAAGDKFMWQAA